MAGVSARSRPRRRSFNLRRFRWVVTREAAVRVFCPDVDRAQVERCYLVNLARTDTWRVAHLVDTVLALHPDRRYWPRVPE